VRCLSFYGLAIQIKQKPKQLAQYLLCNFNLNFFVINSLKIDVNQKRLTDS
jgi:hypothetical protein